MARKPVIAGVNVVALLATVAAAMQAEPGYAMLTAAEVEALGDNAEANPNITEGDKVAVRLTDAGLAAASQSTANTATTSAPAGGFEIEDGVAMPAGVGGGPRGSIYPFDKLNVGQSFHVPATAENPTPAKSLASTVSSATARYAVETGETGEVTINVYQTDASGAKVKDPATGKWIKTGERKETRPKMQNTRVFAVRAVDASDPKGAGARVWRTQ